MENNKQKEGLLTVDTQIKGGIGSFLWELMAQQWFWAAERGKAFENLNGDEKDEDGLDGDKDKEKFVDTEIRNSKY